MVYAHLTANDDESNSLSHFGIKGMRWGVRRKSGSSASSRKSADYKKYESLRSRSTSSLSNKQLKTLNERMQLEATNAQLSERQTSAGKKAAKKVLSAVGNQALGQLSSLAVNAGINYLRSQGKGLGRH